MATCQGAQAWPEPPNGHEMLLLRLRMASDESRCNAIAVLSFWQPCTQLQ